MKSSQFSTRLRRRQQFRQKTWNNLVIGVIVLIPIYPAFGSYMQDYTGAIVRGEYDQSTIIDAQDGTTGEDTFDILDIVDVETVDVLQPEIPAVVPEPVLPEPPPSLPIDKKRSLYLTHVVASGDTLSTLAQKYDVSLSALREVNNLSDNFLALKQKLIIPRIKGVSYTVQKGDTLSTIAEKYGITQAQNILLANDLQQGGVLSIGKVLLLPNPTKDPTKKVVNNPPTKKPVATTTNKTKTASPKKETPTEIKTLTYGGYSLDLKVEK